MLRSMTFKSADELRGELVNCTHSNSALTAAMDTHDNV